IWDGRKQELFLARDRLGKKPLYYSLNIPGLRICFASELKAFKEVPGFDAKVKAQAVADFLCLSYVPDPDSIFHGVAKLSPGHSLTLGPDYCRVQRYWSPELHSDDGQSLSTRSEELRCLATNAVQSRMI